MHETSLWAQALTVLLMALLVHISLGMSFYKRVQSSSRHRRRLGELILPLWLAPGKWAAEMTMPCPALLIDALKAISRLAIRDPLKAIKISAVIGWPHYSRKLSQVKA